MTNSVQIHNTTSPLLQAAKNTFELATVQKYLAKTEAEKGVKISALFGGENRGEALMLCNEFCEYLAKFGFAKIENSYLKEVLRGLIEIPTYENLTFLQLKEAFNFALVSNMKLTTYNQNITLIYIRDILANERENNNIDFQVIAKLKAEESQEIASKPKIIIDFDRLFSSAICLIKYYENYCELGQIDRMKFANFDKSERGNTYDIFSDYTNICPVYLAQSFSDLEFLAKYFDFFASALPTKKEKIDIYNDVIEQHEKHLERFVSVLRYENPQGEIFLSMVNNSHFKIISRLKALEKVFSTLKDSGVTVFDFAFELGITPNNHRQMNYSILKDFESLDSFLDDGNLKELFSLQPFQKRDFSFFVEQKKVIDTTENKLKTLVGLYNGEQDLTSENCAQIIDFWVRNYNGKENEIEIGEYCDLFGEEKSWVLFGYFCSNYERV
jgi:hypothetical protein